MGSPTRLTLVLKYFGELRLICSVTGCWRVVSNEADISISCQKTGTLVWGNPMKWSLFKFNFWNIDTWALHQNHSYYPSPLPMAPLQTSCPVLFIDYYCMHTHKTYTVSIWYCLCVHEFRFDCLVLGRLCRNSFLEENNSPSLDSYGFLVALHRGVSVPDILPVHIENSCLLVPGGTDKRSNHRRWIWGLEDSLKHGSYQGKLNTGWN